MIYDQIDRMVQVWISYNIRFKCTIPAGTTIRLRKPDGSAFTDEEINEIRSLVDEQDPPR